MRKIYWIVIVMTVLLAGCNQFGDVNDDGSQGTNEVIEPTGLPADMAVPALDNIVEEPGVDLTASWVAPLERASERVTKKTFGMYIDSASSPVQPERFSGYHTGVDFEIFPAEVDQDVMVKSVCTGRILVKENVSGYGGVVVTSCMLENEQITVLYGHLDLGSITRNVWDEIKTGDEIGKLGSEFSDQTDGERKHLHLSFHKGEAVNYAGYVNSEAELGDWIDPCDYVCEWDKSE